jgi:hypothetical protein
VVSQLTTVADTANVAARFTEPAAAASETEPLTWPGAAAASRTGRLRDPATVVLDSEAQFGGNVTVPMLPAAGVVLTPGPDAPVTDTVTVAPFAKTVGPEALPLRWMPTRAGLVTVDPAHTVPKLSPAPVIGVTPSPSATTLSAHAAGDAPRIRAAAPTATTRTHVCR